MPDLYGVIDSSGNITKFYVSPDFGVPGSNKKLISNVIKDIIHEYPLRKTVSGADGYKYRWADPDIVEKPDNTIRDSLEWKKNKRDQLAGKAEKDTKNLKGEEAKSLMGKELLNRLNSGPALTQPEIDKIQAFEDSKQTILDQMDTNAEADKFSNAENDSATTDAPDIDVKKPGAFAVNDQITIIDDGVNPKEETATIATIVSNRLTFDTALTNTTKYKQDTTGVYKTG